MCSWRAVLGKGSELGNAQSVVRTQVVELKCGEGKVEGC